MASANADAQADENHSGGHDNRDTPLTPLRVGGKPPPQHHRDAAIALAALHVYRVAARHGY